MIKCTQGGCPDGKNICCYHCPDKEHCEGCCTEQFSTCGHSQFEAETSTEMAVFESSAALVIHTITEICVQKKALEDKEKEMRSQLEKAMEAYGVKKFENDQISVVYVEPTTRNTIDSAKLKKELPDVASKYTKTSAVKGSVKITVKE